MNVFRLAGDVSHLVAIIVLLLKIWRTKSCAGELELGKSGVSFSWWSEFELRAKLAVPPWVRVISRTPGGPVEQSGGPVAPVNQCPLLIRPFLRSRMYFSTPFASRVEEHLRAGGGFSMPLHSFAPHVQRRLAAGMRRSRRSRPGGISGKSQVLFALVFTTRYLDLFSNFISIYNTVMKVVFLGLAYATVYLIYMRFRNSYDSENDSFRVEFLLVPVAGLSFLENYAFTPMEILWTFSIYLESVAILPQLFMITKTGEAESITTHYLFFLGLYRALYLANWVWRYHTEGFLDKIAVVSGVVQTIFYCDFFYLYFTRAKKLIHPSIHLPKPPSPATVMDTVGKAENPRRPCPIQNPTPRDPELFPGQPVNNILPWDPGSW
ncbi:hypothetical protein NFI96_017038 [Prochilodus magdalenae]|nr:hypothetical protein NFI96_017038 [Prochilodus magdalenae]